MNQYNNVYFEISGICNAKCPFCISNKSKRDSSIFIDPELFYAALKKLINYKIISQDSEINVYNWGEPLLHPKFNKIIDKINSLSLKYCISTNASIVPVIDRNLTRNLSKIYFSMSGFSQKSYSKIHGFNFEKIKSNIIKIVKKLKSENFTGEAFILFHIYQFNIDEILIAYEFAKKIGVKLLPYYAYLCDYNQLKNYIDNNLNSDQLKLISESLFCSRINELTVDIPKYYKCPQDNILSIDEKANIINCCFLSNKVPKNILGNVIKDDIDKIFNHKPISQECIECLKNGFSHYIHNVEMPEFIKKTINDREYLYEV